MIDTTTQIALALAMLSIGLAVLGIREALRQIIHHRAVARRLEQVRTMKGPQSQK
jgi:hypothetical protein